MKKLMRVETNASTMFVTYDDEEKIVRVLDNEETNPITDEEKVRLEDVEDDSSWDMFEDVEDVEEWLGIDYNNPDTPRIVEEIETDI